MIYRVRVINKKGEAVIECTTTGMDWVEWLHNGKKRTFKTAKIARMTLASLGLPVHEVAQ